MSYSLKTRLWPPESVIAARDMVKFKNIKLFIPNGEEVGTQEHYTSPFMTSYIAKWEPAYYAARCFKYHNRTDKADDEVSFRVHAGTQHQLLIIYNQIHGSTCAEQCQEGIKGMHLAARPGMSAGIQQENQ